MTYIKTSMNNTLETDACVFIDNAVPIEGWISDPTDNDLMHLIPLLEGLQYCTDVRAVLSLRLGQPQAMSPTI